jgi:spermidine synthase
VRTGFLFGLLNVLVALLGLHYFAPQLRAARRLRLCALGVAALLIAGFLSAAKTTSLLEDMLYDDEVIYARTTPYQRLVITRWRDDIRLFIDGNIQFSSLDEFRYHEALVHPAMNLGSLGPEPVRHVLLLGAGDGMAAREVLKYPRLKRIDLVDLDPEMTRMFSSIPLLVKLNQGALKHPRVHIFNEDAQKFLERHHQLYDVVIIDLPDPNNESLGKLYTRSFYRLVAQHLSPRGVLVTQATSPFYSTNSFWCIVNTLSATTLSSAGGTLNVRPYHASVPSFGEWGFVLASLAPLAPTPPLQLHVPTRFLTSEMLPSLFIFPRDIGPRQTPINRLDNQILVQLYEKDYGRYQH